eukprot:gene8129-8969_t
MKKTAHSIYLEALELTKDEIKLLSMNPYPEEDTQLTASSRAIRSGHSPCNFVVGDTDFGDFLDLLSQVMEGKKEHFVDLGCGRGEVMAAALLYNIACGCTSGNNDGIIASATGYDLMHFKVDECRRLLNNISDLISTQGESVPPSVVLEEDFLESNWWSSATIVYACATCFSTQTMEKLIKRLNQLSSGAKVILLDRELPSGGEGDWKEVGRQTVATSWGQGEAFLYHKVGSSHHLTHNTTEVTSVIHKE